MCSPLGSILHVSDLSIVPNLDLSRHLLVRQFSGFGDNLSWFGFLIDAQGLAYGEKVKECSEIILGIGPQLFQAFSDGTGFQMGILQEDLTLTYPFLSSRFLLGEELFQGFARRIHYG